MKRYYIIFIALLFCLSLHSCGKQTGQVVGDSPVLSDAPSPSIVMETFPTDVVQAESPTTTPVLTPTEILSCTPSPVPSPISPEPTLPPLDITLVDDGLPWDEEALPETDYVYIVRFIPTDRDDLLVAYKVCVDVQWDMNDFYDDQKRPKKLYTWWLQEDAFCFVRCNGSSPVGYNEKTTPDYIAQDLSRWKDVEPGMYNISHDLFRWLIKWYEINWWCGVKDGEIVYVRQHIEG